jgi:hypothetical protein
VSISANDEAAIVIASPRIPNSSVTLFIEIYGAITTECVGLTIGAAFVSVAYIAVVTNFAFLRTDDTIAAAADRDARVLIGGTDLPRFAPPP